MLPKENDNNCFPFHLQVSYNLLGGRTHLVGEPTWWANPAWFTLKHGQRRHLWHLWHLRRAQSLDNIPNFLCKYQSNNHEHYVYNKLRVLCTKKTGEELTIRRFSWWRNDFLVRRLPNIAQTSITGLVSDVTFWEKQNNQSNRHLADVKVSWRRCKQTRPRFWEWMCKLMARSL